MKNFLLNLTFITLLLSVGYSQFDCNESNWESFYPYMHDCYLPGAYLIGVDLEGAQLHWADLSGGYLPVADLEGAELHGTDLSGACLDGAIGFTQTHYIGTPILEGCASGGGDCSFEDTDEDGYDDESYDAGFDEGALSGDANGDGESNILDIVFYIEQIFAE